MIPSADIQTEIPSPLPTCQMPARDEISDEGFGGFRGTWWIGRVPTRIAESMVRDEAELLGLLDHLASTADEFDLLARAIERQDLSAVPEQLLERVRATHLPELIGGEADIPPLDGLEVGVAGLTYALSSIRCLTAASCRSHSGASSWADYPVVVFVAPPWRVELLAPLVAGEGCGLDSNVSMLTIYGRSVVDLHALARRIIQERRQFRVMPDKWKTRSNARVRSKSQLPLF